MQPEKWAQLRGQIQDSFGDVEIIKEELTESERGEKEITTFTGPLGRMKIEYITRPVILDKKTIGSRRIGSGTTVEYVYSEDEFSHTLKVYKWDEAESDWSEIDVKGGFSL